MAVKPRSKNKTITVNQVALVSVVFALGGAGYGFFTGGTVKMVILFSECFIGGFILFYIGASFIELFRR